MVIIFTGKFCRERKFAFATRYQIKPKAADKNLRDIKLWSSPVPSQKQRFKSLRHFVQDGLWSSVCDGFAENNFSPLAVFLSASAAQIGAFSASQQLLGCWLQLWSEKLIKFFGSRKRLVLFCVSLQSVFLGLMTIGVYKGWGFGAFFIFAVLFTAFGSLSGPAWNAWVSDLLPGKRRGACFAVRNQRTYPASFISLVVGGILLDLVSKKFGGELAFCLVFFIGYVAKLCTLNHLVQQQEHRLKIVTLRAKGPIHLLKEAWTDRRMRRIVTFFGAMGFACNLSGPFQVPYILKTLHYSYFQFTLLLGSMAIGRFLAAPFIGRYIDRFGSRRLLSFSAALMPFSPFGWLLTQNYFALLAVFFVSGVIWAGFDMCSFSYLAECVPSHRRPRVFAARLVAWGLFSFFGASLGGLLLEANVGHSSILISGFGFTAGSLVVFWASTIARSLAALSVLRIPKPVPHHYEHVHVEDSVVEAA